MLDTVKERLNASVTKLAEKGYTHFITGGALGFDTLAAQTVLYVKKSYPDITLHLVLPCSDQDKLWNGEQKRLYQEIIDNADSFEYVCDSYTKWCMAQRNRRMVELSSVTVAYYDGKGKGGTAMTVGLAEKNGLEIINLF